MRLTRQAALAIALVAGLLAALFAWMFIGQQKPKTPPPPQTVEVPVPREAIPAGTELQGTMFQMAEVPAAQVTAATVTDPQALDGRIAVADLAAGQAVQAIQVQERTAQLGMAYALNEGLRAMAVSLDIIGAVGDFIKPMDRVDVLLAYRDNNYVVTRTLVQNVVVLALGRTVTVSPPSTASATAQGEEPTQEAPPRRTETPVTLALTPQQSQIVLAADQVGDLRLTLRARGDNGVIPLPNTQSWTLVGPTPKQAAAAAAEKQPAQQPQAQAPQPAPAQPARQPEPTGPSGAGAPPAEKIPAGAVEVIRGGEREYVVPEAVGAKKR